MRYTYAPLREMCTSEQKKRVEEVEARLMKLRDEVSETFRREIDNERLNAQFDPEERKQHDDLVQEYEQHERQFADIENVLDVGT